MGNFIDNQRCGMGSLKYGKVINLIGGGGGGGNG